MKIRKPKTGQSLADQNTELCQEWSDKNILGPENYTHHSGHKVWWQCSKCAYEWEAHIHNRASNNGQCPSCRKTKQVLTDNNRLSILYPEVAKEWDIDKNTDTPNDVSFGSNKKRWWICSTCGYSWLTTVASRTVCDRGCKKCNTSLGEQKIEKYLLELQIPYQREYKIPECKNKFSLPFDFAVFDNGLKLIEYHGPQHYEIQKYWGGAEKLLRTQRNDKIKLDYCAYNSIPLLSICYKDYAHVNKILSYFLLTE